MSGGVLCSMDVTMCRGLVYPPNSCAPRTSDYDFIWKSDLYTCIPGRDKDVIILT